MNFLDTINLSDGEFFLKLNKTTVADPSKNWLPAYYFSICKVDGEVVGTCDLRIGHNESVFYGGNIGYFVEEDHRGNRYALKACKLLFKLARMHKLEYLYITCAEDNTPSRKTCEYLNGDFIGVFDIPENHNMYKEGKRKTCIFKYII